MDDATQHNTGMEAGTLGGFHVYATQFTALNNSGVNGYALLFADEGNQTLTVRIHAEGLEPGQVHAQHIHGFADDTDSKSPTIAQDADADGFVELGEGLVSYGPIQLNLTLNPGDSQHDHGTPGHDHTAAAMFPAADAQGNLNYTETFRFDRSDPNAQAIFDRISPFEAKEIVLHGLTVREGSGDGTAGEVDGTAGYKGVLPVASGELHEVDFGALLASALGHGHAGDWLFGAA